MSSTNVGFILIGIVVFVVVFVFHYLSGAITSNWRLTKLEKLKIELKSYIERIYEIINKELNNGEILEYEAEELIRMNGIKLLK